ncbi:MAG TPA: DUF3422 family protein [Nitrospiraceae bacterium]|nr:DUF3422 family protein [Nitrospiraceae bacterium]
MSITHSEHNEHSLRRLHERPQKHLEEWLAVPAHVHHVAHRMANPPIERPRSREEFRQILHSLEVPGATTVLHDKFGYGVRTDSGGDRLIVVWDAHTEYYSYQVWHIPSERTKPLSFGPLTYPKYFFPLSPLGLRVNALDIVITQGPDVSPAACRSVMPGPTLYGGRVLGEDIAVVTTFTPDEHDRERYLVISPSTTPPDHLLRIVDAIVRIETYYHLILMQKPIFSSAVDEVHAFEQLHLRQREIITGQLNESTSASLQRWLNHLTEDLMKVNRLAGRMHYELSAAVPYDKIVKTTMGSLQEQPLPSCRLLSDYVLGGVTGVAEGYQQLLRRIETLKTGFEGIIAIIRARVDLLLEEQNLVLLTSVDQTTKSQAILQHTVEGLSIILIAYYLSGLANYVFKGLHDMGWISNATIATAAFVPISVVLSFALMRLSRRIIEKRLAHKSTD